MRGTRWLLLVAIVVLLGGIGIKYRAQLHTLRVNDQALAKPRPLPDDLNSSSVDWHWVERDTKDGSGRVLAEIWAKDASELKDSSRADLKGVTLRLTSKKGDTFDLIKSASANFFKNDKRLYSEDDVDITLNMPVEGQPKRTPVNVKTSGVTYDTDGRAETDRPSSFVSDRCTGTATGAAYDPNSHLMLMKNDVVMHCQPRSPHAKPMLIEAGSLQYLETQSEILLTPWGRLTRENTVIEGENVVIHLQKDDEGHIIIQSIDAVKAHGTDSYPTRKLQYSADQLWVAMDEDGVVQRITAQTNAHLISTSDTTETTIDAGHVDMNFGINEHESTLSDVSTSGNSVVTAKPVPAPGKQLSETHILRSDALNMKMRPGGRNIESVVVTHGEGTLEFLPNQPIQHHRLLEGGDMVINYGADNRIESFHTTNSKTHTDPTDEEKKRNRVASITASRDLLARFDPKTGKMTSTEQTGDFTYDEGDRHARAAKATLDAEQNLILLQTSARMWDTTGSTSADHIRMDEKTGDFTAEGKVNSSRLPEKDEKKNSQMLSGDQPLQAQARRMDSRNHNRSMHYEGDVTMWQGANRIQAQVIDIDREKEKKTLVADGNVITSLWEEPKDDPKNPSKKKKANTDPVLTVVHAPHLVYTEENRLAVYTGGVLLTRPGLEVKSKELRAFLADSGGDSRLEKAFAEGAVRITDVSKEATRIGTSDHAEYYTADQRVFLRDGHPQLEERRTTGKDKTTTGDDLTYYANDDRLVVNGSHAQPGQSQLKRK
ncbi:MAG TPA: LptA/OstA family protein [Bryobacteraceae bacterium]|nr:LptA/OstA family protein [Bryobacteraceae bacterium]